MLRASSLSFLLSALQFSQAINVYLNPWGNPVSSFLSPQDASSVLSRHLGLETFEPLRDASRGRYNNEDFVGQGLKNSLLLTIDEDDVNAILPSSTRPSFKLSPANPMPLSLSHIISTCLHRAQQNYASVFSEGTLGPLDDIDALSKFFVSTDTPAFAAVELKKLSDLRQTYGSTSVEYIEAAREIRLFLQRAYSEAETLHVALLTFTPSPYVNIRRQPPPQSPLPPNHPPPQEPIGSISACFTSADACTNGTTSCSGRGQCVEASKSGKTCYICVCGVTRTGEGSKVKTDTWAGQSCERKDISGSFVLLVGTASVMLLLILGSISLLSSVGNSELPSTLLATAVHAKKE